MAAALILSAAYNANAGEKAKNRFGLVYGDAITKNVPGGIAIKPVSYKLGGIKVAANLYLPANFDKNKKYAAITVAHPNGGVKEQVAGLFAQKLAEAGYVAIAADARYQGASGGTPRNRDYPANRIEDISGMADYLISLPYVDSSRIGSLGICGGGGYTLAAAQQDKRIKSVAVISMFNSGRVRRNGFKDADKKNIQARLAKAALARENELAGEIMYESDSPKMTEQEMRAMMEKLPEGLYKDGTEYYGITHAHPNSTGRYTTESLMRLMAFDVDDRMDLITQPLLMIAGEIADTKYMTDSAYAKAVNAKNKELFIVKGATHIRTYWVPEYVSQEAAKVKEFFGKNL